MTAAGGSANGDRPPSDGSIGEITVVASANRAVRGLLKSETEEEEEEEDLEELRMMDVGFF